jgi:hypothetical protein
MEIFDLNDSNPFEERDKNVLFQSGTFKVRLIQLKAGVEILPCTMAMDVIFCVLQGKRIITVNDKTNEVKPHSLIVTSPATISMRGDEGMKVLGIQIGGGT